MAFKLRSDLHLARRLFHFIGVSAFIYLFQVLPYIDALKSALILCGVAVLFEISRLKIPAINRLVVTSPLGPVMRKQELRNLSGLTYFVFGGLTVIYFFPKPIATLSLVLLAVGDPVSSIFGILYGKDKIIKNKTLQGSIAGFIACTVAAATYFAITHTMVNRIVLVSIVSGAIGAIAEIIPVGKLDDNFTFPVISASLFWILSASFGGFFDV